MAMDAATIERLIKEGLPDARVSIDDLRIKPEYPALIAALEKCEFKSLLQEVRDEASKAGTARQAELLL